MTGLGVEKYKRSKWRSSGNKHKNYSKCNNTPSVMFIVESIVGNDR